MLFKQHILFTEKECNSILDLIEVDGWTDSTIINSKGDSEYKPGVRKTREFVITDNKSLQKIVIPKVKQHGIGTLPVNTKILEYEEGSFFKRHADRGRTPIGSEADDRLMTLIIQLSGNDDYNGGELIVDETVIDKTKGNTIIFDSGALHQVNKLISGKRYALVSWIKKEHMNNELGRLL